MAVDKYSRDYRLIDSVDDRGRIRTETEYIGENYRFQEGEEAARSAARRMALFCALAWLSFVAALFLPSAAMKTLYAALPCAFTALPLWLLSSAVVTALRVRVPFVHRDADRLNFRLPATAVFSALFPAFAIVGELLSLLFARPAVLPGDWVFLAGNGLCLLFVLLCRRLRGRVAAEAF